MFRSSSKQHVHPHARSFAGPRVRTGVKAGSVRLAPRVQRAARSPRHGLGLVEALISLAIAAALLTAVAIGFVASARAINENDQFFRAAQSGRVSLNRILTQVRRGTPANDSTATSLHLLTDTGQDITYSYNSTTKQLKLVTNTITTD